MNTKSDKLPPASHVAGSPAAESRGIGFEQLRAHYLDLIAAREAEIEHLRKRVRQCDELEAEAEKDRRAEKRALSKAMK